MGIVIPLEDKSADRLIEPLTTLVAGDMAKVNQTILSRTGSEVTMIPEVANHLIASGGKRMRPILTLATAGLCGYGGEGHIKLAAAVEFMHTATLLHDDVVDESDMRRGKEAARVLWGNEASVLVGDFLLGQAFKMMVEVGSLACLEVLSSAAAVIAEGEVMQLSAAKDTETTEDAYLAVIRAKTAALFAAACEVGPILAGRAKAEVAACRASGPISTIVALVATPTAAFASSNVKIGDGPLPSTTVTTPPSNGSSNSTTDPLVTIRMLDKTHGWAMADSSILKTADGGLHWQNVLPANAFGKPTKFSTARGHFSE